MNFKKEIFALATLIILIVFIIAIFNRISLIDIEKYIKAQDPVYLSVENGMVLTVKATGYAIGPPYNSITRNGSPVINRGFMRIGDVDIFTIAADPKVLKMGSIVYIEGLGLGLVHDTGTAIKGMKIDICFTTMDQAMEFGKQKVKVHLLKNGKENKKGK